jgi:SP family xylose:H+ symportor-like MFS transporter
MNETTSSSYLWKLTLVATLGGLLFGYDTAVISGTVSSLDKFFVQPFGLDELSANARLGFLVSSALIGCIIGGVFGGLISKRLGRKNGLILAAILFFRYRRLGHPKTKIVLPLSNEYKGEIYRCEFNNI